MRYKGDAFKLEVLSHLIEILHLSCGNQSHRVHGQFRLSAAALIIEDHHMLLPQHGEVANNGLVIEPRTSVNGNQRVRTFPDHFEK